MRSSGGGGSPRIGAAGGAVSRPSSASTATSRQPIWRSQDAVITARTSAGVDQHDARAERPDILVGRLHQLAAGRGDARPPHARPRIRADRARRRDRACAPPRRASAQASRRRCGRCRSGAPRDRRRLWPRPSASREASGARADLPLSQAKPASVQPMVPLRSATTLFGTPALISDCAPMMLRVRPAQLTTTMVSGEGARSRTRSTSSAPGTLTALGMETRWYSSNGRLSSTTTSLRARMSPSSSSRGNAWRGARMLDELAERLARHVDAGEQLETGSRPGRNPAVQRT